MARSQTARGKSEPDLRTVGPSRAAHLVHLDTGLVMIVILTVLARLFEWSGETLGWAAMGLVALLAGPGTALLFRHAEHRG